MNLSPFVLFTSKPLTVPLAKRSTPLASIKMCYPVTISARRFTEQPYTVEYLNISKNTCLHSWFLNLNIPRSKIFLSISTYGLLVPTII